MTEAQTNPLQTILDEFKTLSPETTNAIVFDNDGQTIANTKTTTEEQTKKLVTNFSSINQQAQTIGGVENLTIQAADNQLTITTMNNLYLATVSSRAANQEIVKSLTQVVVPTVAKFIGQTAIAHSETQNSSAIELEDKADEEETVLPTIEEPSIEPISEPKTLSEPFSAIEPEDKAAEEEDKEEEAVFQTMEESRIEPVPETKTSFEPFVPSAPVNQFMVEKISGLLVPPDTVRIDGEVIAKWSDLYRGKPILTVNIEALDGKKTTCKVKPIKETKNNAKGVIQIPEKILQNLRTERGKLVMVRPAIK